ncbi:MAG: RdgB/HAM1 family non-canonical purine NTP pyrophosphatase [Bacteroidales bacterium]|nr:RdgB/HAM1 family non-canonical purine NTP pyrophosphatase [Bacteroidales bacterium]
MRQQTGETKGNARAEMIFATGNAHKLKEFREIVGGDIVVCGLSDMGCDADIPEDAETLEGNALAKARWVAARYGAPCFADDTGLEVDALDGRPGVHSARYGCAEGHDAQANRQRLLSELQGVEPAARTARFRTVIAYIDARGAEHLFEGTVEGHILDSERGGDGFGYDPLFVPAGWTQTFAEAGADRKNAVSHRGRAVRAFVDFLRNEKQKNNNNTR